MIDKIEMNIGLRSAISLEIAGYWSNERRKKKRERGRQREREQPIVYEKMKQVEKNARRG